MQNDSVQTKVTFGVQDCEVAKKPTAEPIVHKYSTAAFPPHNRIEWTELLRKALWITLLTYVGVFCRCTLTSLCSIAYLHGTLLQLLGPRFFLPNMVGCLFMGCLAGLVDRFDQYSFVYTAITVGFCGSCTTFSSWNGDVATRALAGDWTTALFQSIGTISTSISCYVIGRHTVEFRK